VRPSRKFPTSASNERAYRLFKASGNTSETRHASAGTCHSRRICPDVCQKDPSRAIEIAKALRVEARREISKSGGGKEVWKVLCEITAEQGRKEAQARGEQFDERFHEAWASAYDMDLVDNLPRELVEYIAPKFTKYRSFESGVKYITGEKRLVRAMPWFRKFIRSRTQNEEACEMEIVKRRRDGFTPGKLLWLGMHFDLWKPKEKSLIAKTKSAKRRKKLQVSKNLR
jgi:hypothetical protein